jgi:hypothetical protein
MRFLQTDHAWTVSEQLLLQGTDVHQRFLGAQSLYKKLQNDFDTMSTGKKATDPFVKLRDKLFEILIQ